MTGSTPILILGEILLAELSFHPSPGAKLRPVIVVPAQTTFRSWLGSQPDW